MVLQKRTFIKFYYPVPDRTNICISNRKYQRDIVHFYATFCCMITDSFFNMFLYFPDLLKRLLSTFNVNSNAYVLYTLVILPALACYCVSKDNCQIVYRLYAMKIGQDLLEIRYNTIFSSLIFRSLKRNSYHFDN